MSLRLLRLWLAAVICGAGSVFAQSAPSPAMPDAMLPGARPTPPPAAAKAAEGEMLPSLQLADASIDAVLDLLEMLTGKSVIRPQALPPVPGITFNRKKPISKDEAILALETVLSLNQIGVAPMGDKLLKVVALGQVKMEAPTLISGSTLDLPASGRVAAKFFQLDFLQTTEIMAQLQAILTQGMVYGVVPFDRANALFITDTISNLQRVELLLKQVDHPNVAMPKPKPYSLKFAKASDIVLRLQAILQGQKMIAQVGIGSTTTISADDRTNKVFIVADARLYPMFDDLIEQLDTKGDSNTHTEVIHLKAADSTKLAPLITQLINGQATAAQVTARLGTASTIHFAGHATRQEGVTRLLLAPSAAGTEKPYLDSELLRSHPPRAARLAVFSACSSGRKDEEWNRGMGDIVDTLAGEGVPEVVATRWQIDSASAVPMMNAFYGGLARGLTVPRALTEARQSLMRDARYRHPYYWAAYYSAGMGKTDMRGLFTEAR